MTRFVILAAPRTGSNLLCTLLQSHPDVLCHHEIFNPDGIFTALPLRATDFNFGSMAERDADPLAFLERVWRNGQDHKSVGFKMTHRQQVHVFNKVCADPDIHKIVLKRRGALKTYVSYLLAERSGIWEDYRDIDAVTPPEPVAVDYKKLKAAIDFNEQYYANLEAIIRGPRTDVTYEKLFNADTQQRLLNELGLSHHALKAGSRRQNPQPLSELIGNRERLAKQLSRNQTDRHLLAELNDSPIPKRENIATRLPENTPDKR